MVVFTAHPTERTLHHLSLMASKFCSPLSLQEPERIAFPFFVILKAFPFPIMCIAFSYIGSKTTCQTLDLRTQALWKETACI